MGGKADVDDLVGVELAQRLSRGSASLVHCWRKRYLDFQALVLEIRQGHIWHWPAVEARACAAGRLE